MSFPRRPRGVASNRRLSDDGRAFDSRNRTGLNPYGSRESEDRRPDDTLPQVSSSLDPSLIAAHKDKVFSDDRTPNRPA